MAINYPINQDTGEPTFLDRRRFPSIVPRIEIVPPLVRAEGFALNSIAAVVYGDHTRWADIAELSRLLHPAEFDFSMLITLPSSTQGAAA